MNQDQFAYWLQGFVEMNDGKEPTKQQWQMIKDHLQLCFLKITRTYPTSGGGGPGGISTVYHVVVGKPTGGGGGC